MGRWPTSLRSRLTMWYALFLGAPLIVFGIVCYVVFSRTLEARTDQFINDALTAFARELGAELRLVLTATDAIRSTVDEVRLRYLHSSVLDLDGRVLAMTDLPEADAEEADAGERRPSQSEEQRIIGQLRTLDLKKGHIAT